MVAHPKGILLLTANFTNDHLHPHSQSVSPGICHGTHSCRGPTAQSLDPLDPAHVFHFVACLLQGTGEEDGARAPLEKSCRPGPEGEGNLVSSSTWEWTPPEHDLVYLCFSIPAAGEPQWERALRASLLASQRRHLVGHREAGGTAGSWTQILLAGFSQDTGLNGSLARSSRLF